ncbi:MAG: hypothetical protein ACLUFL_00215 [Flavonifractor plautii]
MASPTEKGLDDLTPADARKYIEESGSRPAPCCPRCSRSVLRRVKPGRVALITCSKAADGISGKTGTRVHQ